MILGAAVSSLVWPEILCASVGHVGYNAETEEAYQFREVQRPGSAVLAVPKIQGKGLSFQWCPEVHGVVVRKSERSAGLQIGTMAHWKNSLLTRKNLDLDRVSRCRSPGAKASR